MIEITLNGVKRTFDGKITLTALLEQIEMAGRRVAVVRNGEVVHREDYASTMISGGDSLDIIQMVGGG